MRCPKHPALEAIGTCTRCGTFVCGEDSKIVFAKLLCDECAARPEFQYLETFRLKYWGRRDGWAWVFGVGAVFSAATAVSMIGFHEPALALAGALGAVNSGAFWLGKRWARYGLFAVPVLDAGFGAFSGRGELIGFAFFSLLVALSIFNDARNKLFFKVPLTEQQLHKAWDLYANNSMARNGLILAVISIFTWLPAPIALALSIIGLTRVDPEATPPIGKRGSAIAGIIISVLVIGWALFVSVPMVVKALR